MDGEDLGQRKGTAGVMQLKREKHLVHALSVLLTNFFMSLESYPGRLVLAVVCAASIEFSTVNRGQYDTKKISQLQAKLKFRIQILPIECPCGPTRWIFIL